MFQLATSYLTLTDAGSSSSSLKQPCWKTRCLSVSEGQIIGMHQAKKTSENIAETTKIWFRTVQRVIKNWTDRIEEEGSLKRLVNSNRKNKNSRTHVFV